jgi:hypothetical protein
VSRSARALLVAAVALCAVAAPASAAPLPIPSAQLGKLWTTVLETPSAQNPFGSGGAAFGCLDLGITVAPFAPMGVESCTVKAGTPIFVAASSVECSTFEGHGTTEAALRACARAMDVQVAPRVAVDGRRVPVFEVETRLLTIVLPEDNIFDLPAGERGLSVGHGWVTLVALFRPGTHRIVIRIGGGPTITTAIVVLRRR